MKLALSRTVVALNNIGVELLHRQLFSEALTTLHDAARLMKCFLADQPVADEWNMLQRAQMRLCQPNAASSSESDYPAFMDLTNDPFAFLDFMKNDFQCHQIFYTIRISDVDTACYEDLDIQSAILLYNTGLAYHFAMQSHTIMVSLMKYADDLLQLVIPEEDELVFLEVATIQLAIWHCCSTIPQLSHLSKELSSRARELEAMLLPSDSISAAAA